VEKRGLLLIFHWLFYLSSVIFNIIRKKIKNPTQKCKIREKQIKTSYKRHVTNPKITHALSVLRGERSNKEIECVCAV